MAHNFTLSNAFRDLRMDIATRHISYLCEDKSPEKLKCQNLLEGMLYFRITLIFDLSIFYVLNVRVFVV